jgi:hypothetical protein
MGEIAPVLGTYSEAIFLPSETFFKIKHLDGSPRTQVGVFYMLRVKVRLVFTRRTGVNVSRD